MWLRARTVLPLAQPAIENGALLLAENRLARICRWSEVSPQERAACLDLGEVVLLPGLINAHCHLDYTAMGGKIPPRKSFVDWIKALVALKGTSTNEDFAASWKSGAAMLLRNGTTTVADVEAVPELIPGLWETTPLRVISFRELLSVKNRLQIKELVEATIRECSALPSSRIGLSPHAPYTTSPLLLQLAAKAARENNWRLMTHVAESEEEFAMFEQRSGPLFDWLQSQRDMSDCGLGSPVQHLERWGYLQENLLAVHVNYLARDDPALLARCGVSVVHCPRSHDYFKHRPFPLADLARAGVKICLGTDSMSSISPPLQGHMELNLFAEMQAMAANFPKLSPPEILNMVTLSPALALGLAGKLGQLTTGATADLIALPFNGPKSKAVEAVLSHQGAVTASMIDGEWALPPRN